MSTQNSQPLLCFLVYLPSLFSGLFTERTYNITLDHSLQFFASKMSEPALMGSLACLVVTVCVTH